MTPLNYEPPYDDIFKSWSLSIINSPNPPVDEQNIRSGARNIWGLEYITLDDVQHSTIFKLKVDADNYLNNLVLTLRYPQ